MDLTETEMATLAARYEVAAAKLEAERKEELQANGPGPGMVVYWEGDPSPEDAHDRKVFAHQILKVYGHEIEWNCDSFWLPGRLVDEVYFGRDGRWPLGS